MTDTLTTHPTPESEHDVSETAWWRQAAGFQIHPRSFADGTGAGLGGLRGITSRIPYLRSL